MGEVLIREERESDWFESECITKKAFWNLHVPGCNEHYLVHLLRSSEDYLPELSRVATSALKESGVTSLLLSVDAFHQAHIPLEKVHPFAEALCEERLAGVRLHPAWVVNREHANPYNEETEICTMSA